MYKSKGDSGIFSDERYVSCGGNDNVFEAVSFYGRKGMKYQHPTSVLA